jgi:Na+-driven multidrug efflux pump
MAVSSADLGKESISKLLIKQAVPASVGILFMTVNMLIDAVFVGRWIGPLAIAALSVVMPLTFFISSLGLAIGIGGSSVLSRALGKGNQDKAINIFAHQIVMTFLLCSLLVVAGVLFEEEILLAFGANGDIMQPAKEFYLPILLAVPFQALCMMGNSVIRAEDKTKHSMISMIISAAANILLDVLFISILDWGIFGAAMATALSFFACFLYILWFLFVQE